MSTIAPPMSAQSTLSGGQAGGASMPVIHDSMSQDEMKEAAAEFEAMFLGQMLAQMFTGVDVEPPFGGGHGEEMYRSLMIDEYGKAIADNGGIGIADAVMRELIQMQES